MSEKHKHDYLRVNVQAKTAQCSCGHVTRLSRLRGYRKPEFR
jgi:hypothetical protein